MMKAVRERVRNGWQSFRARSVFFQLKALIAAVYFAAILATVGWVMPRRGPSGRNELGARVVSLPGDPVMGRYFVVQNESGADWLGVTFIVDGDYTLSKEAVLRGEKLTVFLRDFTRKERVKVKQRETEQLVRAPTTLVVTQLTIRSGNAVAVTKLGVTR